MTNIVVEYTDPDNLCADFRCRSEYAIPVVRVEALREWLESVAEPDQTRLRESKDFIETTNAALTMLNKIRGEAKQLLSALKDRTTGGTK